MDNIYLDTFKIFLLLQGKIHSNNSITCEDGKNFCILLFSTYFYI